MEDKGKIKKEIEQELREIGVPFKPKEVNNRKLKEEEDRELLIIK